MQTLYKDEAVTVAPNLDGYLLFDFAYSRRSVGRFLA
jgi:hypothetical protein